jgi:hypothetical protein
MNGRVNRPFDGVHDRFGGAASGVPGVASETPGTLLGQTFVPGGWYFSSPDGKWWDQDNFSPGLGTVNARARLPWGCLDYRRTFGSQLAMNGE